MVLRVLKAAAQSGLIVFINLIILSCNKKDHQALPYYNTPDFTPLWLTESKQIDTIHRIAPFSVTDQDNNKISGTDLKGKIYVADFFFTSCPGICPKMTKHMKILADSFINMPEVSFISFSVTPDIDSIPRLKAYAIRYGVNASRWHMVTGKKSEIYQLARKSYFVEKEPGFNRDSTEFLHTEHFVLVDQNGYIRGIYNGTIRLEIQRLAGDISALMQEH